MRAFRELELCGRRRSLCDRIFPACVSTMAILLILTGCTPASDQPNHYYLVKYLTFTSSEEQRQGLAGVKVLAHNTRTGEKQRVEEPFRDKIAVSWCDELRLQRTQTRKRYSFSIDLLQNARVRELVRNSSPDSAWVRENRTSCHQGKNLIGLFCNAFRAHKRRGESRMLLQFHCIYDKNTEEVIFVDSEKYKKDEMWRPYHRAFFDVNGNYLYYTLHGLAKRFDIRARVVDTIPGGSYPIVPHNQRGLIVYSADDEQYKLLNDSHEVCAVIEGKFPGEDLLTAYAVGDSTFLMGVSYGHSMAVYELDFKTSSIRKVFDQAKRGQILSAERLN